MGGAEGILEGINMSDSAQHLPPTYEADERIDFSAEYGRRREAIENLRTLVA